MARIVVSDPARSDIRNILNYLANHGGHAIAERYAADFEAVYDRLADFPDSGAPRPTLGHDVRSALVPPFVVIYGHSNNLVTVLRILHGKRNITRDLVAR